MHSSTESQSQTAKIFSVSELVGLVKTKLEGEVGRVALTAEVSSFRAWRSGHWYFDLKDERALVPAVMFRHMTNRVKFAVEDGQQVLVEGKVSVYAPQSRVQLVVDHIKPIGQGALMLAFEQLKKRLEAEGLFSASHKKNLPSFPKTVGIVTSPQGAVLRDIVKILNARMPGINVLLAQTRVQGDGSGKEIAEAIKLLDQSGKCDVMIVGRGGGSLEDLWAFNEEVVARAVSECSVPVVSAVGHETDVSICDYVADIRCATPTHAAQEVVPDYNELNRKITDRLGYCGQLMDQKLHQSYLLLERISKRLVDPKAMLLKKVQQLHSLSSRIEKYNLGQILATNRGKTNNYEQRLSSAIKQMIKGHASNANKLVAELNALSPLSVLARGYSAVYKTNKVITSALDVNQGDHLDIRFQDGMVTACVEEIDAKK